MYRSPVRLHLSRDGKVVPPGDPQSASLLVPAGGEMSDEDAKKYGLIGGGPAGTGPAGGGEDALPLDSKPAAATPDPSATKAVAEAAAAFPQQINLGAPPAAPQQTPPVQEPQQPTPQAPVGTTAAPETAPTAPTQPPASDLPVDFPFKSILVSQNFGTKEQVKNATKEQLIGLDQIGAARADEIIAAREKLG